jgi:hypothetical protein
VRQAVAGCDDRLPKACTLLSCAANGIHGLVALIHAGAFKLQMHRHKRDVRACDARDDLRHLPASPSYALDSSRDSRIPFGESGCIRTSGLYK